MAARALMPSLHVSMGVTTFRARLGAGRWLSAHAGLLRAKGTTRSFGVSAAAAALSLSDPSLLRERCYVGGQWIAANDGRSLTVNNPATGEQLATVPSLSVEETEQAIAQAQHVLPEWAALTAKARSELLWRWYHLVEQHKDDLAVIMTAEQGKPLAEARGEVDYGNSFLSWFAEEGRRVYGDTLPMNSGAMRGFVIKQPVGVCAAITPWNFPNAMITRKAGAALAAGCTMVVKPAELTPLSALALAELAHRAGIPPGVLNVVTGDPSAVGGTLATSPVVAKLSFTGSTATGKLLMQQCAGTVKRISMELGGNAPFLVFDDADLDSAVEGALKSKYRNSGQTCVCANRFLVHTSVHDAFVERLTAKAAALVLGNGLEGPTDQGPLINAAAIAKCERHVEDAVSKGAHVLVGGGPDARGPLFFQPTVLTGCTDDMLVFREETFGPVAPIFTFSTEDEALRLANDTSMGLAAYVYTRDVGRAFRCSESLQYGMVGVNSGLISTEVAPFGGVKQSGIGREGSRYGIEEYLSVKYVCFGDMDQ